MFCQKCNLHYPDHLSFCRRCGQPLSHSTAEQTVDSHCCTRCGARVVRGENFCQQCGNRIGVALQDTVIGACYHCGTSWRSGWLFCKNCGLDRKRALLLSTSLPSSSLSPAGAKANLIEPSEGFSEIAKVNCQFCGAEAKPYSRFCESCGRRIDGTGAEKPVVKPVEMPLRTPREQSPPALGQPDIQRAAAPTLFDEQLIEAQTSTQSPIQSPMQAGEFAEGNSLAGAGLNNLSGDLSNNHPADAGDGVDGWQQPEPAAETPVAIPPVAAGGKQHHDNTKTVVTPLPPFGRVTDLNNPVTFKDVWARNRQAILQSAALLAVVVLLGAVVIWWSLKNRASNSGGATSTPSPSPVAAAIPNKTSSPVSTSTPLATSAPEGMVAVPGGQFEMGRSNGDEFERPAHTVTVEPFLIDRTEVTNEEYQRFVLATGRRAPQHWQDGKFPAAEAKMPVVNVSWDDANAYAKWANKRLPTEAEWEYAARGTDGRIYAWGNTWDSSAGNAGRENGGRIVAVGSFPKGASPFGALDMCGNVWEWTASTLRSYADGNQEIAPGKVIRGGAFDVPSNRATATYRGVLPADRQRDKTGFRCVRDLKRP